LACTTCRCVSDDDAAIRANSARCVDVHDKAGQLIAG
jgi:hypothetical protein